MRTSEGFWPLQWSCLVESRPYIERVCPDFQNGNEESSTNVRGICGMKSDFLLRENIEADIAGVAFVVAYFGSSIDSKSN